MKPEQSTRVSLLLLLFEKNDELELSLDRRHIKNGFLYRQDNVHTEQLLHDKLENLAVYCRASKGAGG